MTLLKLVRSGPDRLSLVFPLASNIVFGLVLLASLVGQLQRGFSVVLTLFALLGLAGALYHERWDIDRITARVVHRRGLIVRPRVEEIPLSAIHAVRYEQFEPGRETSETTLDELPDPSERPRLRSTIHATLRLAMTDEWSRPEIGIESTRGARCNRLLETGRALAEFLQVPLRLHA